MAPTPCRTADAHYPGPQGGRARGLPPAVPRPRAGRGVCGPARAAGDLVARADARPARKTGLGLRGPVARAAARALAGGARQRRGETPTQRSQDAVAAGRQFVARLELAADPDR